MTRFFLKQYLRSKTFILSVALLYLFLLISAAEDLAGAAPVFLILDITNALGVSVLLRPLAAALPISLFLMHEWGTHYYQMVLSRGSCINYAGSKALCACLVGFLVPFLANLLLLLTVAVYSPGRFAVSLFSRGYYFPDFALDGKLYLSLLLYVIGSSFSGAVWAAVVTGLSVFTTNAYVLIAAPFLLDRSACYLLQLLARRLPYALYLDTSCAYVFALHNGFLVQLLFTLFLCFLSVVVVFVGVKRRRRNG